MSFTRRTYEVLQRFKDLGKLKRLRTFIALRLYSSPWAAYCYLSKNVLHEALFKLRRLRVLSLSASTSMQWSSGLDEAIHQCLIVSTLRLSNTDHFAVYMEENSTNEQGSSHGLATLAVEKQVGIPDLGALFSFWLARIIQLNPTELNHDQINKKEIWYDQCERRVVGESDAILSATISHIIDQLSSLELLKLARRGKIHSDIKKLEANLHMIHAVLDDAEEKQMESHAVKVWLDQIRELAYDIEDLLDGVFTDLNEEQRASSSKAKSAIPRFLSSYFPGNFVLTYKIDSKIKRITARLQEIAQKKNNLELRENGSGGVLKSKSLKRLPSTSLVDLSYG
ncbi:hypothetical protein NC651_002666 [Populus alba x Populus x berolinensis]|nr:hypothetical protein NC651_002666 [Populus alba x Populus x berolinensis]